MVMYKHVLLVLPDSEDVGMSLTLCIKIHSLGCAIHQRGGLMLLWSNYAQVIIIMNFKIL